MVTGRPRSTRLVTPCSRMPQGTMPSKWLEVRIDVDGDAVEADPAAQLHADGGDLVLAGAVRLGGCRAADPDADPAGAPLARHVELGERAR